MKTTPAYRLITLSALCACMAALPGCEDKKPVPAPKTSAAPGAAASNQKMAAAIPPANIPAPAPGTVAATDASGGLTVGAFTFTVPAGWKVVPPANQMRLAEMLVADASGDAAKACTVVFSSAGGDVQSNIDRWAGQVRDAAGQPGAPKTEKKTIGGVPVTVVEINGAYSGMGETAPHTNWMLRGAIMEDAAGTLFIKMTGPAEQMSAAAPGFASMIDGLKKR